MGPSGADGWVCPAAGHGAWGDHRGVPGGPAKPQLECSEGCPVSEGTITSCLPWCSVALKTGSAVPYLLALSCAPFCSDALGSNVFHGSITLCPSGGAAVWAGSSATGGVPQSSRDVRLEPRASRLSPSGFLWPCPPQVSELHTMSTSLSQEGCCHCEKGLLTSERPHVGRESPAGRREGRYRAPEAGGLSGKELSYIHLVFPMS